MAKTWFNGEIPARLFFEILESGKLAKLVKDEPGNNYPVPATSVLKRNWDKIYDEFYRLKDDRKLRLIVKTRKTILRLYRTIEVVKPVLWALANTPFNEEQLAEIVEQLKPMGVVIDLENPMSEEVLKALQRQLGGMETQMKLEEDNLANLVKGEKRSFEDNLVIFEEGGYQPDENMSLRMYCAKEKALIRKAKRLKTKKNGK